MNPVVVVDKLASDPQSLEDQFRRSFEKIDLIDDFKKAKAVFIKPNLTYPTYKKGVTTRKEFIEVLVSALRKINSTTTIYIGEGEGGYNSFSMTDSMREMGFVDIENKYRNVKIVNISNIPSQTVVLTAKGKPYPIDLPKLLLNEVDFCITCPLPKVHAMTILSLALKNQWGCLPDTMRLKNHFVFQDLIGQINDKLKFKYAFLDGKYGLDKNGPMMGETIKINWFAASNSLGAFDLTVSRMMDIDWRKIGYLKKARQFGFLPSQEEIKIIGDMETLKKKFILRRDFWNYPALAAFHSNKLTYLFYFSGLSKLLHDIMYTFRKKPF